MSDESWITVDQSVPVVDRAGRTPIGTLEAGSTHRTTGSNDHWFMIRLADGTTGFVARKHARIVSGPPGAAPSPPEPTTPQPVAPAPAAAHAHEADAARCPNCGNPLQAGDRFCRTCGAPVAPPEPPARVEPAPQPGAQPPIQPPPPSSAPTPTPGRGGRGWIIFLVIVLVAGAAGWYFFVRDDTRTFAEGEVFLEPANDPGPEAFTTMLDVPEPPEIIEIAPVVATVTTTTTTTTAAGETTTTVGGAAFPTVSGGEPGLYGGTQDTSRCDPQQMARFLADNPDKGRAWIQGINADPNFRWSGGDSLAATDIPTFLGELTPITLVADTRVTNNGYRNGVPTPRQAVLQAGTSVLVDTYGVPRAKCNCGNPLAPPLAQTGAVKYTGNQWDDFAPETTVVVQPSPTPLPVIELVDLFTGQLINRPVGTTGSADVATGVTVSAPLVDPTVAIATTSTTLAAAATTSTTTATTSSTTTTTALSVLTSGDFCQAWFEYVAIDDQYIEQYEDPDSVPEYQEFVLLALTDLAGLAPDYAKPGWEWYRDNYARNPNFLENAGAEEEEAFAMILRSLEEECGFAIFDEG